MENNRAPLTSRSLTALIVVGVVLQGLALLFTAAEWPTTETDGRRTVGETGNALLAGVGVWFVGLAGVLVVMGAAGWGALLALQVREGRRENSTP